LKLTLSRKGFDASAGGGPSPILPDGRLASLPIPDPHSPLRYAEVRTAGMPAGPLVESLTSGRCGSDRRAHLDPDLDPTSRPRRPPGWRPLFGQRGSAQAHLEQRGFGCGDLFLFFGWFRRTTLREGRLVWERGEPNLHVLFGWLQVGSVHPVGPLSLRVLPFAHEHPHLHGRRGARNTLYVAARELSLPGCARLPIAGAGLFPFFHPRLCLTDPEVGRRSCWSLPSWWHPSGRRSALSYHANPCRWRRAGDGVRLSSVGRGQEFVLDLRDYPEAIPWLASLLRDLGFGSLSGPRRGTRRVAALRRARCGGAR
jgi:hypothetical protein